MDTRKETVALTASETSAVAEEMTKNSKTIFSQDICVPPPEISENTFKSYLFWPSPLKKSIDGKRKQKEKQPAISSEHFRKYLKRKSEISKKTIPKNKIKRKIIKKKNNNNSRDICCQCDIELIGDTEDESLMNIGCDTCPRWYLLKCTKFNGSPYEEVRSKEFICSLY